MSGSADPLPEICVWLGHWAEAGITRLAFSSDGRTLWSMGHSGGAILWDAEMRVPRRWLTQMGTITGSPDGSLVASREHDGKRYLRDARTGRLIRELAQVTGTPHVFSPNGRLLATSGEWSSRGAAASSSLTLWDIETGEPRQTLWGHATDVHQLVFSPNGAVVASAESDGVVRLRDARTGAVLRRLAEHYGVVQSVAYSPDGRAVASASSDGTVRLWDAETGALLWDPVEQPAGVNDVAFSPNGALFASASSDGSVSLWEARSGTRLSTLTGHEDRVVSLAFSPDGRTLVSGSEDGTVRLWEVGPERRTPFSIWLDQAMGWSRAPRRLRMEHGSAVDAVAFSPDGSLVASAGWDQSVRLWDARDGSLRRTLSGQVPRGVASVAFSPDGGTLACLDGGGPGWREGRVALWDVQTGECLQDTSVRDRSVRSVAFSPDGKELASGGAGGIFVWDAPSLELRRVLTGHCTTPSAVAYSPDGEVMATGGGDGVVRLWDVATGALLPVALPHVGTIYAAVFSPDGSALASVAPGRKDPIHVWSVPALRAGGDGNAMAALTRVLVPEAPTWTLAFSPDSKLLVSGETSGTVRVWPMSGTDPPRTLAGHPRPVKSFSFSPDGTVLASGDTGDSVILREVRTGKMLSMRSQCARVRSLAFSPDGMTLAHVGDDGLVRTWDLRTGELLQTRWQAERPVWLESDGSPPASHASARDPGGTHLANGDGDGTVSVSDLSTGEPRWRQAGHHGSVVCVAFSPDGATLASGGEDGTVKLWLVSRGEALVTLYSLPAVGDEEFPTEWLAVTPEGYYSGSEGASRFIQWRAGDRSCPGYAYVKLFQRPDMVQAVLRGERVPPPQREGS